MQWRILEEKIRTIEELHIYGDFFGKEPLENLEKRFLEVRYEREDIVNQLNDVDVKDYFGDVSKDEFIDLVHGDDE